MSPWFQVFSVESFVFFGTANALYQQLKSHLANQKATKPKSERTKYLIFDLADVTGIDSSAKNVFFKVCMELIAATEIVLLQISSRMQFLHLLFRSTACSRLRALSSYGR